MSSTGKKFIVVGGGIGGLAAAVALSQQGVNVTVLEQATELGEIGAGVQLGARLWRTNRHAFAFHIGQRFDAAVSGCRDLDKVWIGGCDAT